MTLSISASADYDLEKETFLILMVEPSLIGSTHRMVQESLRTTPLPECTLTQDALNNPQRRMLAPGGFFTFDFTAIIETEPNTPVPADAIEHTPQQIPHDLLPFLLPSHWCPSDLLRRMARGEFGRTTPGGARVLAIADWVQRHIAYRYTSELLSHSESIAQSAGDTALCRIGGAQDFAHLVITFCRALGIPARYVSGYALGLDPPDFHAWTQVFLSGGWHNVDATSKRTRPALVPIAFGRDAGDVPPILLLSHPATCRARLVSVEVV